MKDVSTKGELINFGLKLWRNGGRGMLISGGCGPDGSIPFPDHTFEEISFLKDKTGLLFNLHCGLIKKDTARKITGSGVDKVSFDFIYNDYVINEILGLERTKEDYLSTLEILKEEGITVAPHLLAGLDHGRIHWEFEAVNALAEIDPREIVLIILIPTKNTPFQDLEPPDEEEILSLGKYMRGRLSCRLILGCMRPRNRDNLDFDLLDNGFDGIVLPSKVTLKRIKTTGWLTKDKDTCCCL
jgi:uncharacterized radical SAM superfamily protein